MYVAALRYFDITSPLDEELLRSSINFYEHFSIAKEEWDLVLTITLF